MSHKSKRSQDSISRLFLSQANYIYEHNNYSTYGKPQLNFYPGKLVQLTINKVHINHIDSIQLLLFNRINRQFINPRYSIGRYQFLSLSVSPEHHMLIVYVPTNYELIIEAHRINDGYKAKFNTCELNDNSILDLIEYKDAIAGSDESPWLIDNIQNIQVGLGIYNLEETSENLVEIYQYSTALLSFSDCQLYSSSLYNEDSKYEENRIGYVNISVTEIKDQTKINIFTSLVPPGLIVCTERVFPKRFSAMYYINHIHTKGLHYFTVSLSNITIRCNARIAHEKLNQANMYRFTVLCHSGYSQITNSDEYTFSDLIRQCATNSSHPDVIYTAPHIYYLHRIPLHHSSTLIIILMMQTPTGPVPVPLGYGIIPLCPEATDCDALKDTNLSIFDRTIQICNLSLIRGPYMNPDSMLCYPQHNQDSYQPTSLLLSTRITFNNTLTKPDSIESRQFKKINPNTSLKQQELASFDKVTSLSSIKLDMSIGDNKSICNDDKSGLVSEGNPMHSHSSLLLSGVVTELTDKQLNTAELTMSDKNQLDVINQKSININTTSVIKKSGSNTKMELVKVTSSSIPLSSQTPTYTSEYQYTDSYSYESTNGNIYNVLTSLLHEVRNIKTNCNKPTLLDISPKNTSPKLILPRKDPDNNSAIRKILQKYNQTVIKHPITHKVLSCIGAINNELSGWSRELNSLHTACNHFKVGLCFEGLSTKASPLLLRTLQVEAGHLTKDLLVTSKVYPLHLVECIEPIGNVYSFLHRVQTSGNQPEAANDENLLVWLEDDVPHSNVTDAVSLLQKCREKAKIHLNFLYGDSQLYAFSATISIAQLFKEYVEGPVSPLLSNGFAIPLDVPLYRDLSLAYINKETVAPDSSILNNYPIESNMGTLHLYVVVIGSSVHTVPATDYTRSHKSNVIRVPKLSNMNPGDYLPTTKAGHSGQDGHAQAESIHERRIQYVKDAIRRCKIPHDTLNKPNPLKPFFKDVEKRQQDMYVQSVGEHVKDYMTERVHCVCVAYRPELYFLEFVNPFSQLFSFDVMIAPECISYLSFSDNSYTSFTASSKESIRIPFIVRVVMNENCPNKVGVISIKVSGTGLSDTIRVYEVHIRCLPPIIDRHVTLYVPDHTKTTSKSVYSKTISRLSDEIRESLYNPFQAKDCCCYPALNFPFESKHPPHIEAETNLCIISDANKGRPIIWEYVYIKYTKTVDTVKQCTYADLILYTDQTQQSVFQVWRVKFMECPLLICQPVTIGRLNYIELAKVPSNQVLYTSHKKLELLKANDGEMVSVVAKFVQFSPGSMSILCHKVPHVESESNYTIAFVSSVYPVVPPEKLAKVLLTVDDLTTGIIERVITFTGPEHMTYEKDQSPPLTKITATSSCKHSLTVQPNIFYIEPNKSQKITLQFKNLSLPTKDYIKHRFYLFLNNSQTLEHIDTYCIEIKILI